MFKATNVKDTGTLSTAQDNGDGSAVTLSYYFGYINVLI
jgi:hypothetical protein